MTHVWYSKHWEHHTEEFVDQVHFSLVTASAGPTWQEGQLLALPDGSPAVWSLPGDASDWTNNYATPYFSVEQTGGWFSKDPKRIHTPPCLDPALCLLIGHLATSEFSAAGIKEALHPDFPHDPRSGIIFGMMNKAPPPPPVILVQQPYPVQYMGNPAQFQSVQVAGFGAPQPQMMQQQQQQQQMMMQQQQQQMMMQQQQQQMMQQQQQQQMAMQQQQPQQAYGANYAQQPAPGGGGGGGEEDITEKLTKLKKMLDAGLIDPDDYEKKKDELLEKI